MSCAGISVVIPTFNRAKWIVEALQSVMNQSLLPQEVIVVDDGSTDETEEVCRPTCRQARRAYPGLRYFYQDHCGVSAARNRGIREARGEWIATLDSDDLWERTKLEQQWLFIQDHPGAKIIQTEEIWIRRERRVNPRKIHQKKSGWIFNDCIPLCIVSPSAVMIHREVFNKVGLFDEKLPACEDYDFWLRASLQYPIDTMPEPLTIKRGGHDDQLSRQWGLDRYRIRALCKILDQSLTKEQRNLVTHDIERRCTILICGYEKRGMIEEANYYRKLKVAGMSEEDRAPLSAERS